MEREPNHRPGRGPAATFTGDVWVGPIATRKPEPSRMIVALVRLAPGVRTAWRSHANGQTLHVHAGVALMQGRGGEVFRAHPGETVYTPRGERHWHGASADDFMEHLAMLEGTADGDDTTWLEHVSDREHRG